jgi:hypothetical protein
VTFQAPQATPAPSLGASIGGLAGAVGRFAPLESPIATAAANPVLAPYQTTPDVEVRAATDFMQDASADLIRKLYRYLEANGQQYQQLSECVPLVRRAAELYGARDYTAAFSQAYQAYRAITIQRSSTPGLPGLDQSV